ncbi:MAG: excinuclease ABC subunit UvrC [Alphaproteobacteria bacterium]|jgi:excinuclease ABC subunit C|nr:excinuclease ABC subunit UvrC [Alphaproteobacteria bacterium]
MSTKKITTTKFYGKDLIKSLSSDIPTNPGVYKMIDSQKKIIYIGKAKNLKNRLTSYSNLHLLPRTEKMVSLINNIEWVITKDEQDALLLESDLIKHFKPRYNILLKDDKTFPFIKIDTNHPFPKITRIRSKNGTPDRNTFGPFASSSNVNESIKAVQRMFQVRSCTDNYFENRKQPCVLYQIKRCSAPCVDKISAKDYMESIKQTTFFLKGSTDNLKNELTTAMLEASKNNNFEQAIIFRERIKALSQLNSSQSILLDNHENSDFIALIEHNGFYLFKVFMFKNGHNYGSLDFPNKIQIEESQENAVSSFITQFYDNRDIPDKIYLNINLEPENTEILQTFLKTKKDKKTIITNPKTKKAQDIMDIVIRNAFESLNKYEETSQKWQKHFEDLKNFFKINKNITKIEVYDNSHLYGTFPLGAMISARIWGFEKKEYRTFHLKDESIDTRDDYAILRHTLLRRFSRMLKEKQDVPELVFIDGGKGQLNIAMQVLAELQISNIRLVAVAKGVNRNAGEETLFLDTGEELHPNKFSSTLHFIQMIRNEVHRHAVKSVAKRKLNSLTKSEIDKIPEIGSKRKKDLLNYFGSIDKVKSASIEELKKVKGISESIAKNIFNYFH